MNAARFMQKRLNSPARLIHSRATFVSLKKCTKPFRKFTNKRYFDHVEELQKAMGDDDGLLDRINHSLGPTSRDEFQKVIARELKKECPVDGSSTQMLRLAFMHGIPMIGFGFMDNLILVLAGDYIDSTICYQFGFGTLFAAAIANAISDTIGLGAGGMIERMANNLGMKHHGLSLCQLRSWKAFYWKFAGMTIGITFGCILGMFPLAIPEEYRLWESRNTRENKIYVEHDYEVSSGYRCTKSVTVRDGSELGSTWIGVLKVGTIIEVEEINVSSNCIRAKVKNKANREIWCSLRNQDLVEMVEQIADGTPIPEFDASVIKTELKRELFQKTAKLETVTVNCENDHTITLHVNPDGNVIEFFDGKLASVILEFDLEPSTGEYLLVTKYKTFKGKLDQKHIDTACQDLQKLYRVVQERKNSLNTTGTKKWLFDL